VTALEPPEDGYIKTRWEIMLERVERLRCFHDEGMRTQFIKLANVWGIWQDLPTDAFNFPFALMIAALLLDRNVIMAAEDVKVIAFDSPRDRQVVRTAEKLVIEQAINLIEPNLAAHTAWLPPQCFATAGTLRHWWLSYEFDLRIWDFANRMHRDEKIRDSGLTRWNARYGQVARIKAS
jgi:hypothetical protein